MRFDSLTNDLVTHSESAVTRLASMEFFNCRLNPLIRFIEPTELIVKIMVKMVQADYNPRQSCLF